MTAWPDEQSTDEAFVEKDVPQHPSVNAGDDSREKDVPHHTLLSAGARRGTTTPAAHPGRPDPTFFETDRYREEGKPFGSGGSSVVIQAYDKEICRYVAVKILKADARDSEVRAKRFETEARITGQLEHPNIAPVYELGADRWGRPFLAMKAVGGVDLEARLKALGDRRLESAELARLLQVFTKVCDAVAYAHSRGVIHRDLKPRNIMDGDFGQVYVLDWGIARVRPPGGQFPGPPIRLSPAHSPSDLDPHGVRVGTDGYMAPEQILGLHDELDERTDVFALGATLYQILTGRPPVTPEIASAVLERRAPPPVTLPEEATSGRQLPHELARIAMHALAYEPAKRYPSVIHLKSDLEAFQRGTWELPRKSVAAGTVIIVEGDAGDAAYVILEGECEAYRIDGDREILLRVMGAGDVFGETAILSRKPRTASVRARTDAELLRVTEDVLSRALGLNSWMGAFVKALADRFREADLQLRVRDSELPIEPGSGPLRSRRSSVPPSIDVDRSAASLGAGTAAHPPPGLPRVTFPAGATIVEAGEPGDAGYFILRGRCVEYAGDGSDVIVLRNLTSNNVFGEWALFSDAPAPTRVVAKTDVELVVVRRELLFDTLGLNSWMGAFVQSLTERLREVHERLHARERGDVPPGSGRH
jgi:CRP-like cAMP-binding protein/tRNA A-37 threonylcarbamoyl transferase component Bud32